MKGSEAHHWKECSSRKPRHEVGPRPLEKVSGEDVGTFQNSLAPKAAWWVLPILTTPFLLGCQVGIYSLTLEKPHPSPVPYRGPQPPWDHSPHPSHCCGSCSPTMSDCHC